MSNSFHTLKSFYKITKLKKSLIAVEFISLLLPALLSILTPILAAQIISDITIYDYSKAIYDLSLEFIITLSTSILYFINKLINSKISKNIVLSLEDYLYSNVKENAKINKISSSTMNGVWNCVTFENQFVYKICFFVKSIVILFILAYFNIFLSLIIIAISLISALLLRITTQKIQKHDLTFSQIKTKTLELFNTIQQGAKQTENSIAEKNIKDKFNLCVDSSIKENNKINLYYNINSNLISLLLKVSIFVTTIYLITLVKSTELTLSLYLILTPYLTSSATSIISFFEIFPEITTLQNTLDEFDSLRYREKEDKIEFSPNTFNLNFYNLCLKNSNTKNLTLNINFKESFVFVDNNSFDNEKIFQILLRNSKDFSGTVLLDNTNIFDYGEQTYKQTIAFSKSNPYFYNLSIFENLFLVCQNKSLVFSTIKKIGLSEKINNLPGKINQIIDEKTNNKLLYFLGIIRAFLQSPKILCINGYPDNFTEDDKKFTIQLLDYINQFSTIIFLSQDDSIKSKNSKIIYLKN